MGRKGGVGRCNGVRVVWEDVMGCGWFRKENLDCEGGLGRRNWSQGWFWENKWGDVGRR